MPYHNYLSLFIRPSTSRRFSSSLAANILFYSIRESATFHYVEHILCFSFLFTARALESLGLLYCATSAVSRRGCQKATIRPTALRAHPSSSSVQLYDIVSWNNLTLTCKTANFLEYFMPRTGGHLLQLELLLDSVLFCSDYLLLFAL